MSQKFQLQAEIREGTGTSFAKKLRRAGTVPAVIYGGGQRNYPIQIKEKAISDLLHNAISENVLVNLMIEGAKEKEKLVLIQDVQHHTLSGAVTHVDFQAVKEDEEIRAAIPIFLTGEPAGVKEGGLLEHQVHSMEVLCLPKDLPEKLTFDVSELTLGEALHVGEVTLPDGVTATTGDGVVIALVTEARTARAEAAEEGEIEVAATAEEEAPAE